MEMRRNQKVLKHDFANPKRRQNGKQRRHGERNRERTTTGKFFLFFLFFFLDLGMKYELVLRNLVGLICI